MAVSSYMRTPRKTGVAPPDDTQCTLTSMLLQAWERC